MRFQYLNDEQSFEFSAGFKGWRSLATIYQNWKKNLPRLALGFINLKSAHSYPEWFDGGSNAISVAFVLSFMNERFGVSLGIVSPLEYSIST